MSVFDGLKFRKVYSPIHNLRPQNQIRLRYCNLRCGHRVLSNHPTAFAVCFPDSFCSPCACSEAVVTFLAWRGFFGNVHLHS